MSPFRFLTPALAAGLLASSVASSVAQAPTLKDPANLTGEQVSAPALADNLPINHGAPALQQLLLKLRTRASLMLIIAHPDDEDGGMLTYESRGQGARVAMLTLTRGEGGQNLMSADFDDALGLIRTQELLAADRYLGVNQFFGTEVDFGFSKTKEEAFAQWTHQRVLYDAVRAVRLYRPLVVASVFLGAPTDGHGQHQVSGEIAQEVFTAAADPEVFPEMIAEGLLPWAPLKVYARVPFSRVTPEGMFDYATGKTIPVRFENYVTHKISNTVPTATVEIHEGDPAVVDGKPALGMDGLSYVQFARQGLALQKTQIGNGVRQAPPGRSNTGYTLMASRPECGKSACPTLADLGITDELKPITRQSDLFDNLDVSFPAIANLAPAAPKALRAVLLLIDQKIAEAQHLFDPAHLEATADPLRVALKTLDTVIDGAEKSTLPADEKFNLLHELRIKRVQLNNALVLALGITLEPMTKPTHPDYAVPITTNDRTIYTNVRITNSGSESLKIVRLSPQKDAEASSDMHGKPLPPAGSLFTESNAHYLKPLPATRPYFSRPDSAQPYYNVADPALRNAPETPAPFVSSALIDDQGVPIEVRAIVPDPQTVQFRNAPESARALLPNPIPQAAVVVPPVTVNLHRTSEDARETQSASSAGIIPLGTPNFQLGATLGVEAFEDTVPLGPARIGPAKIPVTLHAPAGWQVSTPTYNQSMEPVLEHFTITPGPVHANQTYQLTAAATFQQHEYKESYRPVGYRGLTYTNFYTPATYRVTAVDVTTAPNLKVAYLPGTGDSVPSFLRELGVTPAILTIKDLNRTTLAQYDAVILGVRAYAAHPELSGPGSKPLLDYASNGGVVILQYMTARYGDPEAPYPISVPGDSAHNVVDETVPVQLLAPQNPVLTWPNKITSADFNHWVEERGHGFAASWSPEYTPLLETHDPEQDPQRGGLLYAPIGKGAYIYCSLALYRQLPEGVPGAYRLVANLISLAKNPTFHPTSK